MHDHKNAPRDLYMQAKSIAARCRAAGRAAERAQGSDEAQHQAGQAQHALEELVELLDDEQPYEDTEKLEQECYGLAETAFDAVCALRAAERAAAKQAQYPKDPLEQEQLRQELEAEADRPTPRGLVEVAKPHIEAAREFMEQICEDDDEEPDTHGDEQDGQQDGLEADRTDRIAAGQKWDPEDDPYVAGRVVEHKSKSGKTTQRAVIEENHAPGNPRGKLTCVRLSTTGILIPQHVYLRKHEATLVRIPGTELNAGQRAHALALFPNRWTVENMAVALQHYEAHGGPPAIDPVTDDEWLANWAFWFNKDDQPTRGKPAEYVDRTKESWRPR